MTALDTDIVVRLIARNDPEQLRQARALLEATSCFLPDTVLLETAWVLRGSYGATPQQIHAELMAVLGLQNVHVADADRVHQALDWYAEGLDFAGALHLASTQHTVAFATFDRGFIRRTAGRGRCPVAAPGAV